MNTDQKLPGVVTGKKALIFDLFHTLTDIESAWPGTKMTSELLGIPRDEWNEQLEKARWRLTGEETEPYIIVKRMAHAVNPKIPDDLIREVTQRRVERFEGALLSIPQSSRVVLSKLRSLDKKTGLCSNAEVSEILAWPRCPIANLFDSTIFSCYAGYIKPDREIYELTMKELGVSAAECIFVGDGGSNELSGAKSIGIITVMITGKIKDMRPDKIRERQKYADFTIVNLEEMVDGL